MKPLIAVILFALLPGCAAQSESKVDEAISDFAALSGLEAIDAIRTQTQFGTSELTDRYLILRTRRDVYLVELQYCPPRFDNDDVTPDVRYDRNVLRARFDTIRGCRIKQIFAIDEAGAEELKMLAEARGADRG
ncbi:MAG: DUF6491 family protein [Gammaproteobacteria bacterium]|nr:DUF6491 family protein [Gammaproteobacteria bacterium]MDH3480577.1 DUF6491 family protein [Gammaproteobacteria bacterium]